MTADLLGDATVAPDADLWAEARLVDEDGRLTEMVDSSLLTCGADPAVRALGPAELVPADPGAGAHALAVTPPGPRAATLLEIFDPATLADTDLVEFVAASARLVAWAEARAVEATAVLTGRCAALRGVGDGPDEVPAGQVAAVELAAALHLSPVAARMRVDLARDLARLPLTRAALGTGAIDLPRARAVTDAVASLDDDTARSVEARVIPRAPSQTAPMLRAALRRAVIATDPGAAERRRAEKVLDRGVWREVLEDGMSRLEWVAPTEQIEAAHQWVTALARAAQTGDRARARRERDAGTPPQDVDAVRTLDQCRSDVLADLAEHGLAHDRLPTRHGRAPQIAVVVAMSTLAGHDDEPAELVGAGPITAPTARRIAADGVWRRLLTDPAGRLLDVSTDTYEPPQAMRDLVIARDRTCRGPGCRMPAERCDLDHTVEWPCGPTCAGNLCALCRSHHRLKTHTDTTYRPNGHGGHTWTLPSGRTYTREAEPVLDHPALVDHARSGLDPPPGAMGDTPPF